MIFKINNMKHNSLLINLNNNKIIKTKIIIIVLNKLNWNNNMKNKNNKNYINVNNNIKHHKWYLIHKTKYKDKLKVLRILALIKT